jgi:hypothetical protein
MEILSRTDLLCARDHHLHRLEALFRGAVVQPPFFLLGITGRGQADPYAEPERWVDQCLEFLATQADSGLDPAVFRPLIVEYGPFGVHFVDRILGARVYQHAGQWWADRLETPVGSLVPPDLARDETWQLAQRAALAFAAHGLTVPLLGLPCIASALNVALNLRGEHLLTAMLTDPKAAKHDLQVVNDTLIALHRWYLTHIPLTQLQAVAAAGRCQPPGHGQLCGCSTHLLSAPMYEEFVAPLDAALLGVYPKGGMIHLCGVHTQHIPVWREMQALRAIQVNDRAAEDLSAYFSGLRDDQVIYLNPTATMTAALAMQITGGRRLVVVAEPSVAVG